MPAVLFQLSPRSSCALLCKVAALFALAAPTLAAQSQAPVTSSATAPDTTTQPATPLRFEALTDYTVHQDALTVLASHMAAIGTPWVGLRVEGTATLPSADQAVPAELLMLGLNSAILTFKQSSGLTALSVQGPVIKSVFAEGKTQYEPEPVGSAGLLPLQLLHSLAISNTLLALKLGDDLVIDGVRCQKLSLRYALTKASLPAGKHPHNVQVDFYLDAATHLVRRSVVSLAIPGIAQPKLQVTDYLGYKTFGFIVFPQRITQTIDGSSLWDLKVTSASAETKINASEFQR